MVSGEGKSNSLSLDESVGRAIDRVLVELEDYDYATCRPDDVVDIRDNWISRFVKVDVGMPYRIVADLHYGHGNQTSPHKLSMFCDKTMRRCIYEVREKDADEQMWWQSGIKASVAVAFFGLLGCGGDQNSEGEKIRDGSIDVENDGAIDYERPCKRERCLEIVEGAPTRSDLDHDDINNTLEVWKEMIGRARETIDIGAFYMFHARLPDLEEVYSAIEEAASRGVAVRIILDQGVYNEEGEYRRDVAERFNSHKNIEVRTLDMGNSGAQMHAKYFVVDGEWVFVGSQNWSDNSLTECREVGAAVWDRSVGEMLTRRFETDWVESGGKERTDSAPSNPNEKLPPGSDIELLYPTQSYPAGFKPDNNDMEDTETAILGLMGSAVNSINVELYTYSTAYNYSVLDNALRDAASRGVNVRMIVDHEYYEEYTSAIDNLATLDNITVKILNIEELSYSDEHGWVHAKFLTVDGETAWIGNGNWQRDHMHNHRNIGLVFKAHEKVSTLDRIFETDWESDYAELVDEQR